MNVLLAKPFQPAVGAGMSPPLGILYLASGLRRTLGECVSVRVIDGRLYSLQPDEIAHAAAHADVVGLSVENCEVTASKTIANLIKRANPRTVVAVGGPYAHHRAVEVLRDSPDMDWVFDGEADRTFPEAVRRHIDGVALDGILGMYFRRGDTIVEPPGTDVVTDLDALPFPAWDLAELDVYSQAESMSGWRQRRRYATLFTSRGCPYKCIYCHDIFGKRFRFRSAENVVEEICFLVDNYGVEEFQVVDDIFNLHKPRLRKIFAALEERYGAGRLRFTFPNGLRADILTDDVIQTLKRGGTYALCVAVETVTPRLQTLIEKNLDVQKVKRFIDVCGHEGILVRGFFMVGFPTETLREMLATVWFACRSRLTFASFMTVIPQPETPMYALAQREAPEALTQVDQEDYFTGRSWYQLATGTPMRLLLGLTFIAFYMMSPRRMVRIARSIPLWNLGRLLQQFVASVVLRRAAASPGRRRLRRYHPELMLPHGEAVGPQLAAGGDAGARRRFPMAGTGRRRRPPDVAIPAIELPQVESSASAAGH